MQVIPFNSEEDYGRLMRTLTSLEGHSPKLPTNEYLKNPSTAQERWRNKVLEYFSDNPEPIYRVELTKILNIEADTLRRVCRSLVVAGYLSSRRTQTGVVYRSPNTK